jgi:hypothetical protein
VIQCMPAPQLSRVGLCAPPRHDEYVRPSSGRAEGRPRYGTKRNRVRTVRLTEIICTCKRGVRGAAMRGANERHDDASRETAAPAAAAAGYRDRNAQVTSNAQTGA